MFFFEGDDLVFIYCDWEYYGSDVRFYFEFLFYNFEDVNNIFGRKFDYIFVFDGDMGVFDGCVYELLFGVIFVVFLVIVGKSQVIFFREEYQVLVLIIFMEYVVYVMDYYKFMCKMIINIVQIFCYEYRFFNVFI